ncbi:C6 zinc finger domain protein [Thelonectria olida]|uniref:C6 zinc finger domain protein n=1 Tax=Thelonectria olida TaxID=1576542 RepID=A0A9P8VZ09_9HYPO|nr:C6 zinc finger domain protein [Thelonectria olida]
MGQRHTPSSSALGSAQPRRKNVKSGCRTCKIRKVKCDEGRPACHRCVSTGRKCDGYGIWGGGGEERSHSRPVNQGHVVVLHPARNIPPHNLNATECECLEWFTLRTVKKLRGIFRSAFWDKLVFQACFDEPAVRHAVLALSSVQRRDVSAQERSKTIELSPDDQEQFVLRQYGKAIKHLLPQSAGGAQPNVNVVLLSCLVFIFLEFLRGHYRAAHGHLKNGLRLISEAHNPPSTTSSGVSLSKSSIQRVEDGILEAFSRIQVQVALLSPLNHTVDFALQVGEPEPVDKAFKSVEQAREQLDHLMNEVMQLEDQFRRHSIEDSVGCYSKLLYKQQRLRDRLDSWDMAYNLSTATIKTSMPFREVFGYRLLHVYHTMATVMVNTAAGSISGAALDSHTDRFRSIMIEAEELRRIVKSVAILQDLQNHYTDKSQSIADMGWIPPLYYTALKCRDPKLRLQAVELLRLVPHREGIWDSNMVASIAEKVIAIEETGDLANFILDSDSGSSEVLRTSPVAESCRIQDVRVQLPDNPGASVEFLYRDETTNWSWDMIRANFSVIS